jgi:EAL domain-containing protein (putative c-di-GMP-specific phosphodiesterase class I)
MAVIVRNNSNSESSTEIDQGWFLVGCVGESSGLTQVRIGKVSFTIGRAASNDFRLPSQNVSKQHAQLIVTSEAVLIRDLGSTNGTFVNGRRIAAPTPVGDGDLLQFADMELRLGRDNAETGAHTVVSDSPEHGWLISQLYAVIHQDRFEMVFQPIVAAADLRPLAVEALVRCDIIGLESPVRLFEVAARLDLQERLSTLCRTKAVETLADWSPSQQLFLNTHPQEPLGPELVESLRTLREQAGARPLVLEIHEAAVPDLAAMRDFRAALRDMEIGLAYDDFGAGQSRLLELTEIPPDFLKFDRSLLDSQAIGSVGRRTLLRTLLTHAADAGIATVAEGVDSQELVDICRELGFTHFQGYFLGRPMSHTALPKV